MILQALVQHYEDLDAQGEISPPGWGPVKVSYALYLDKQGQLTRVVSVKTEQVKGKKTELAPQEMRLPAPVKRTVRIAANFLWDNSSYILGVDGKGKPERALKCFNDSQALHRQLLSGLDSPAAKALLAFFETWDPAQAAEHPALQNDWNDILSGGNLVFRYDGAYVHKDPEIRQAWQTHYDTPSTGPEMICLVTGQKGPVEAVHPAIKGVVGAQSGGAALVSFNSPAFCSFGREQNVNAPTSKYAAFAYTSALNHLIADREHVTRMGDTTVVCWAQGGEKVYQSTFLCAITGEPSFYQEKDLRDAVKDLAAGKSFRFDKSMMDPKKVFYILGLSPNAARLSVRFFLRNSFGYFLHNVEEHEERLRIYHPDHDPFVPIPVWKLLGETVNKNSKDKSPLPNLSGKVLHAVLNNTPYPTALLDGVMLRIRAEQDVTWLKAGILRAFLKQNYKHSPKFAQLQEVAQVNLNEDCRDQPYVLGRLFALMNTIQRASADWNLNRTIKDSYLNSAATKPKDTFKKLFPLSEHHMKKLQRDRPGLAKKLESDKMDLVSMIDSPIPTRFTSDETICFYLGYYHQSNKKKEENKNV